MKLKLKMIAAAVALVSAAGANAALVDAATGNGSVALVAFNTTTGDYYIRDLGFLLNDFLPSTVTTRPGDGAVTGTRTPDAGLTLNPANTPNFGDASFSSWVGGQNAADIRWMVTGSDNTANSGAQSVRRALVSSINPTETATNGNVDVYTNTSNAGALSTFFGSATLSMTGTGAPDTFGTNFGLGADGLASLNQSAGLFYFARTTYTGSTTVQAERTQFGNASGFATITLESDGDLVYSLAGAPAAVPVPAAAWLLGSGLLGFAGMARRRKAAAKA
ncbi:VPLPA-CTERM sorting domain-containing protein [Rhizobacter sp. J219]|jgi:hypothetical protein|uniref:VPLPA-CTERM sorting domain-containing protein n=1 Tax=Rhizobacter sp. J219 TaxID=2898430 RepID=UPI002150CE2D|nr:VPLPA-CTERM sorting domain-containing protein [Rhizobacter sp. J219]MCR5881886.1 VPLPA-CTERM sorting domain-containing protein [Rhizobacter sp. J219]